MSPRDNVGNHFCRKIMKITLQAKDIHRCSHYNLVHILPVPQAMKVPDVQAAVDKEWKKLEKTPAWQLDSFKSKKRDYSVSTQRQKESPLCYIDGHLSSLKWRVGTNISEVLRSSRTPKDSQSVSFVRRHKPHEPGVR